MNNQYSLTGRVQFSGTSDPISDLRLEVYDASGPNGWLGGTRTNAEGRFELLINDPVATAIQQGAVQLKADLYRGSRLIHAHILPYLSDYNLIELDARSFDIQVPDKTHTDAPDGEYIIVRGTLRTQNDVAVVGARVDAFEMGFRTEGEQPAVASARTDAAGQYELKIARRTLDRAPKSATPLLCLRASMDNGDMIGSSADFIATGSEMLVEITLNDNVPSKTAYRDVLDAIIDNTGLSTNTIKDIKTDDADNEVRRLALLSGRPEEELAAVVRVHKQAEGLGVQPLIVYGLLRGGADISTEGLMRLKEVAIRGALRDAAEAGAIEHPPSADVANAVAAIKAKQLEAALDWKVPSENVKLGVALDAAFGNPADTTEYLTRLRDFDGDDMQKFWALYAQQLGAASAESKQRGLKILALTGFQPQMAARLREGYGSDLFALAKLNTAEWTAEINAASASGTLAVPKVILDDQPEAGAAKAAYAAKLKEAAQNAFPLAAVARKLAENTDQNPLIADSVQRTRAAAFLNANPSFDFRLKTIHDITDAQVTAVTNIADPAALAAAKESLQATLAPFQRLVRIAGGNPDAVAALKVAGLDSSQAITEMSEEDFSASYSAKFSSPEAATAAYKQAHKVAMVATQAATTYASNVDRTSRIPAFGGGPMGPMASPELRTLFGSLETCGCEHCLSVYSPSAYFVDVLAFLRKYSGDPSAYAELIRRRPDLPYIDLTCKNANTPLPYVDLVLELLEGLAIKSIQTGNTNVPFLPASYQTGGTAADLAAFPEHIYRTPLSAYDDNADFSAAYEQVVKHAVYPGNLPFNLALEEARAYGAHLGFSRAELLEIFQPVVSAGNLNTSTNQTVSDITEYNRMNEQLGISKEAADIITGLAASGTWAYYGFKGAAITTSHAFISPSDSTVALTGNWANVLLGDALNSATGQEFGGLDVLLQQLKISFKELMQLLETDFLNPVVNLSTGPGQQVKIVARTGKPVDTCVLADLRLQVTVIGHQPQSAFNESFFSRLHRFVRLWRATDMDVYELDALLQSLGVTASTGLTLENYINVARAISTARKLNTAPLDIAGWWAPISTRRYNNIGSSRAETLPSAYDRLYNNKSVLNLPDPAFEDAVFTTPAPVQYDGHTAPVLAATGLSAEDLRLLMDALGIQASDTITLENLSRIQAVAMLAKHTRQGVGNLIRLNTLAGVGLTDALPAIGSPASQYAIRLNKLEGLIKTVADLDETRLTPDELEYALLDGASGGLVPSDAIITPALQRLIDVVEKARPSVATDIDAVKKALRQDLVARFDVDAATIDYLIAEVLKIEITPGVVVSAENALANHAFTANDPNSNSQLSLELRRFYRRLAKAVWWVKRKRLSTADLKVLYQNQSTLNVWIPATLAADSGLTTPQRLQQLLRYSYWIMVRDRLATDNAAWNALVTAAAGTSKSAWLTAAQTATGWTQDAIEMLVGNASPANPTPGLLNAASFAEFRNPVLLLQMDRVFQTSARIGLTPAQVARTLTADLSLADARQLLKAAKAKHTDEQWLKIAKPLRDVLREKQRSALVAWAVANPAAGQKWRTEAELYAYLLIDPEMSPCAMTSRTRQAISSVQLFIDRVILNLEFKEGNPAWMISIAPATVEQWKEWRKWYRVWEAARKVFLYPENWIEPELRDDKTPFFRELETSLLQDEVTADRVEDAYLEYLEKLDGVARLEPVTTYHELEENGEIDILHVVARTHAQPHIYYYRKLENNTWTAWERMNLEVKGDHVMAVVWNRRLYLFWLTFIEKALNEEQAKNIGKLSGSSQIWTDKFGSATGTDLLTLTEAKRKYWHIQLNWSQRKDGKWLAPSMSKDMMELVPAKVKLTDSASSSYTNVSGAMLDHLTKRGEKELHEVFRDRIYIAPHFDDDGALVVSVMFPQGMNEYAVGMHAFRFANGSTNPYVLRDSDRGTKMIAPHFTLINAMKFVESPVKAAADDNPLATNTHVWIPSQRYFIYPGESFTTYNYPEPTRGASQVILNKTPYGNYRVTAKANLKDATFFALNDHFFFEDDRYSFFVSKVTEAETAQTTIDLDNASITRANEGAGLVYGSPDPHDLLNVMPSDNAYYVSPSKYKFQTFQHPHVNSFMRRLRGGGLPHLLTLGTQVKTDSMGFNGAYKPTALVHPKHPTNVVDFAYDGTYSQYNWELFFHIPMLIAQRLSDNQQFEDAQKWYHYIFDPTSNADETGNISGSRQRFWKFRPLNDEAGSPIVTLTQMMATIEQYTDQISAWERDPFKPHVIARLRKLAYMKNVLMKYLDNLIAWGDQLFSRDTIESVNEATLLYVLAANILGPRPQEMPARAVAVLQNFNELSSGAVPLDAFSNALVQIENFIGVNAAPASVLMLGQPTNGNDPEPIKMRAFCLPANDKLLRYWDTVADRLFKIRHCRNLEGTERSLPLYEPPIDPALLVKAAAAGVSINTVMNDLAAGTLPYRFSYTVQKALELAGDVRGLGSELLSALEKRDAETLALLRSGHELSLLDKMRGIKEGAVREAETALEGLRKTRQATEQRIEYYASRAYMNPNEREHFASVQKGMILQVLQGAVQTTASFLATIPQWHLQVPASTGPSFGGQHLASAAQAISSAIGIKAAIDSAKGTMASIKGGYDRRMDEWKFSEQSARKELESVDKQILGAQIRIEMAKKELANHDVQIENSREADEYMRSKYTNVELYGWMVSQLSAVHFQAYQLAYSLAKKAEACYNYELPVSKKKPATGFIQIGYWDSLRKGLLSASKLQQDLRRMEIAYLEENKRSYELTKHVSLAFLDPQALLDLRRDGLCNFSIPEVLYDMDYAGQWMRRIKSVSISLPCVAGPYTTVSCKLSQGTNSYRKNTALLDGAYARQQSQDSRFHDAIGGTAIATSSAQNDSGVFELSFRDERYLPFEGTGAISDWTLKLPGAVRQFDYDTISDVILHIKYTAEEGGTLADDAKGYVDGLFDDMDDALELERYFSLKHEFSNEWHAYANGPDFNSAMTIPIKKSLFPFFAQNKTVNITKWKFFLQTKEPLSPNQLKIELLNADGNRVALSPVTVQGSTQHWGEVSFDLPYPTTGEHIQFRIKKVGQSNLPDPDALLENAFLVVGYTASNGDSVDFPPVTAHYLPPALAANAAAWWKADEGLEIVNGAVQSWADQSGNNNTLTAISPSNRPTLGSEVNDIAPIVFNGSHALRSGSFDDTNDVTFSIVVQTNSTGATGILGRDSGQSDASGWAVWNYTEPTLFSTAANSYGSSAIHAPIGIGNWRVISFRRDTSNQKLTAWVDNTILPQQPCSQSLLSSTQSITMGYLGGNSWFGNFKILEAIVFKQALTDNEVSACNQYLKSKYGL